MKENSIVILDFGSQYNQLIARRVREMGVYAEVVPYFEPLEKILARKPKGIILSGGPSSVYAEGAPTIDKELFYKGIPVLGICYGMQLTTHLMGGEVARADKQEFGKAELLIDNVDSPLFQGIPNNSKVWMSHNDHVTKMAPGFVQIGHTDSCVAAVHVPEINCYCIQFHAEVTHSEYGTQILKILCFQCC